METPPRFSSPEIRDVIHHLLTTPTTQLKTQIAQLHGRGLIQNADYTSPDVFPLHLSAENALAVNSFRVSQDENICVTEFVSRDVTLDFFKDGIPYEAAGGVYIQFVHNLCHPTSRAAFGALNAIPPDGRTIFDTSAPIAQPATAASEISDINDNDNRTTFSSPSPTPSLDRIIRSNVEDRAGPQGGQPAPPSVLLASVAGPLIPQPIPPPYFPRLATCFPSNRHIVDQGASVDDEEHQSTEDEDDEQSSLGSLSLLQEPERKDTAAEDPSILYSNLPTYTLAYGPFCMTRTLDSLPSYEYRLYLHYTKIPSDEDRIVYGYPPIHPIQLLSLDTWIDDEWFLGLPENQVRLVVLAANLLSSGQSRENESILLHESLLDNGWTSLLSNEEHFGVQRYPLIERLLSVATLLIIQPYGRYASLLRHRFPAAARIIFSSPTGTPHGDSTSTLDFNVYPTPPSHEWEMVSSISSSPPPLEPYDSNPSQIPSNEPTNEEEDDHIYVDAISPPPSPRPQLIPLPSTSDLSDCSDEDCIFSRPLRIISRAFSNRFYDTENVEPPPPPPTTQSSYQELPNKDDSQPPASDTEPTDHPSQCLVDQSSVTEVWALEEDREWNTGWDRPLQPYLSLRDPIGVLTDIYKGPCSFGKGILAYGPFRSNTDYPVPLALDYRIYLHPTDDHDVIDFFAYGGPAFLTGKSVQLIKLPLSPYVADSSLNYIRDYGSFIHQVEAYLRGDPRFREGVPVPTELLNGQIRLVTPTDNLLYFRFPLLESFLATMGARNTNSRFSHPFGRYTLQDIQEIVSPDYPVLANSKALPTTLNPPDLPYIPTTSYYFEHRHPEDQSADLPSPYYGCLARYEAFLFQRNFPKHSSQLYHSTSATVNLLSLHANVQTQPPPLQGGEIPWEEVLEPYSFQDIFCGYTSYQILQKASPDGTLSNCWNRRLHHILQCARQIKQLIRDFETFFQTLGVEGLRDLANDIPLNAEIDFKFNPMLDANQAQYFTALYDFLLREHALNVARPILHLLQISFPEPEQLTKLLTNIVDVIEPPCYSYMLYDEDYLSGDSV